MTEQVIDRVALFKKDKGELSTIIAALGGKATSRMKKSDLVELIVELSGVVTAEAAAQEPETLFDAEPAREDAPAAEKAQRDVVAPGPRPVRQDTRRTGDERDAKEAPKEARSSSSSDQTAEAGRRTSRDQGGRDQGGRDQGGREQSGRDQGGRDQGGREQGGGPSAARNGSTQSPGPSGPRSARQQGGSGQQGSGQQGSGQPGSAQPGGAASQGAGSGQPGASGTDAAGAAKDGVDDLDGGNRRRRRRGRGRDRDELIEPVVSDPIEVGGHLDLRDDGYGFLRVSGSLPSKDDVYVPVKMVRQFELRKGDFVTGTARPANRNEKNPALAEVLTVNGHELAGEGDEPPARAGFDELTPVFPTEVLRLERPDDPTALTPRVIDLVTPIGKGQRGLILAPPKAGKTTLLSEIIRSVEANHAEVELLVLLIDERPEEVTELRRHLSGGEVVASTFDRPAEEHCAVAELTLERAKRMVEDGKDVVIILDGITPLTRAYNLAAQPTGRMLDGGLDAGAIYPPKHFFGSARNTEEGGSLTILATLAVETGSALDDAIVGEYAGTATMELRLDRLAAERGVYPPLDLAASTTRHRERLGDPQQAALAARVLAGFAAGAGLEELLERLRGSAGNEEFLNEMAKAPSL